MRPEPLSPRDALHLAALRGAKRRAEDLNVRGKRRDEVALSFMLGFLQGIYASERLGGFELKSEAFHTCLELIREHGFREVLTQLHVLEGKR